MKNLLCTLFLLNMPICCFAKTEDRLSKNEIKELSLKEQARQESYQEIIEDVVSGVFLVASTIVMPFMLRKIWENATFNSVPRFLDNCVERGLINHEQRCDNSLIDNECILNVLAVRKEKGDNCIKDGLMYSVLSVGLMYLNYKKRTAQKVISRFKKIFNKG